MELLRRQAAILTSIFTRWRRTPGDEREALHLARAIGWLSIAAQYDWSTTVVGGSFARYMFTRDQALHPRDIDVFVGCRSKEEFDAVAVRMGAIEKSERGEETENKYPEHLGVLGVCDLRAIEGIDIPFQLIGLQLTDSDPTVDDALRNRTDVVGGVWVRHTKRGWVFTVLGDTVGPDGCALTKYVPGDAAKTYPRYYRYLLKGFKYPPDSFRVPDDPDERSPIWA